MMKALATIALLALLVGASQAQVPLAVPTGLRVIEIE
jgi:hypothetical protein